MIRVWVAGCATGEEAYSIAILLCEHAERLENPPMIQIFATDIDEQAIADARDGHYPLMIEADVSPERLRAFFVREHGRYRVRKKIREKILFAPHNVLKDSPFSRCDLISCRNLLIYLTAEAQAQIFDVFHFALRPDGLLFMGNSENNNTAQSLFSPVDAKQRSFVRRSTPRTNWKSFPRSLSGEQCDHCLLANAKPAHATAERRGNCDDRYCGSGSGGPGAARSSLWRTTSAFTGAIRAAVDRCERVT